MSKQILELAERLASMPAAEAIRGPQDWAVIMAALRSSAESEQPAAISPAKFDMMRRALEGVQWAARDRFKCVDCGGQPSTGHTNMCLVGRALALSPASDAAPQAAPTRDDIIEECARVCETRIGPDDSQNAPYNSEDKACAKAIRALKAAPQCQAGSDK